MAAVKRAGRHRRAGLFLMGKRLNLDKASRARLPFESLPAIVENRNFVC
jgi:hypothetical protein